MALTKAPAGFREGCQASISRMLSLSVPSLNNTGREKPNSRSQIGSVGLPAGKSCFPNKVICLILSLAEKCTETLHLLKLSVSKSLVGVSCVFTWKRKCSADLYDHHKGRYFACSVVFRPKEHEGNYPCNSWRNTPSWYLKWSETIGTLKIKTWQLGA